MKSSIEAAPPRLAPPGAGLPFAQLVFIRLWLKPVVSRRASPSESRQGYERLTAKLIEKVSAIPIDRRAVPILVEPIRGLEDSSRYWSLSGVLEHLLIVSAGMEKIILSLCAGQALPVVVDTAKVKPKRPDHDFLGEFTACAPGLMQRLDERIAASGWSLDTRLTHRHPWFGRLTARQWYWLLGSHLSLHYRQAKDIIRGLG